MSQVRWDGRRVLVTGADGFLGSHLVERLLLGGARVSAYVRASSVSGTGTNQLKNIAHRESDLEAVLAGDLAAADAVDLIAELAPEVVFHLAADAYVPRSFDHPTEVLRSNLGGTVSVLSAARRCLKISRVVVTSSSEVYGTALRDAIDEDHPLNPSSPYAASKLAGDRLAYAYHVTYGLPIAIIRPFNTYGPRQSYDVIPKFIDLALRGQALTVHGHGEQSRDFTFVDDMLDGFELMGSHEQAIGATVSFGTGRATTILDLARQILRQTGSSSEIVRTETRRSEVARLCCDNRRAREMFGWEPRVDLEQGLERTIDWARGRPR